MQNSRLTTFSQYTCGFYDQPGGVGYHDLDACAVQLEPGITRIYYQNLYSMSVNALSLYMVGLGYSRM